MGGDGVGNREGKGSRGELKQLYNIVMKCDKMSRGWPLTVVMIIPTH